MNRIYSFLLFIIINTGLLLAMQEAPVCISQQQELLVLQKLDSASQKPAVVPVVTRALRDSIEERIKLARRYSTNARTVDFKLARRHINRALQLADSLHYEDADLLAAAGDVEDLAFNYERNKPASGGKTDETACLSAAKQCYLYYQQAYDLYQQNSEKYGKNGLKQQQRLQQTAMKYFLLTNGFQVNAGKSFKKGDLKTTLAEFRMTFDGSTSPFLYSAYKAEPKKMSGFETFLADSTQCKALYNCATVSSALGLLDQSLAYYDSLKVRRYAPEKVYRNTVSIYSSRHDTIMLMTELMAAIVTLPQDTWFQKNLMQLYLDRQQWAEAEQIAAQCIAIDSLDAHTICVRGQLQEMHGEVDKAMLSYLRSYDLDSMQCDVCSFIGRIYFNKSIQLKNKLYNERKFQEIDKNIQPLYEQALPWYERAYELDIDHHDSSIGKAIREILYSRFTKAQCPNRAELIAHYNEVSKAYGMTEFGK